MNIRVRFISSLLYSTLFVSSDISLLACLILAQTYRRLVSNPRKATNTVAPMIAQTMGKVARPICKVKISGNRNCPTPRVPNFLLSRTDDRLVRDIFLSGIGQFRKERLQGCVCSFWRPLQINAPESPACEAFQRTLRQGCPVSI